MAIPTAKPRVRIVSAKTLSFALDGVEKPYPVYRFNRLSGKFFLEKVGHNPFPAP